MNVVLVYANNYRPLAPPPVGLSMLVGPLERAGHSVRVVDLMKQPDPDAVLLQAIEDARPDVVGLSLRNLDNQDMASPLSFVADYARWVAAAGRSATTVIGGSAVMSAPEALMNRTGADFAMVGQAENALPGFLDELASGRAGGFDAPGLLWREGGTIRSNPAAFAGYPDTGSIDWSVIDYARYRGSYGSCCVITKTGCPHRCAFCDAAASFGPTYVPRDPEAVIDDLRRDAVERGFHRRDYFLIDAVLNEPLDWSKTLLESLAMYERRILFTAIVEPTAQFDDELARLLRRAGCGMVTCLVGSWDDSVLEAASRPFDSALAHHALASLERAGVPYMLYYMLGGPRETRETVLANFRHQALRRPIYVLASYGVRVLPRAGIRDFALAEGVIDETDDLVEPRFYLSAPLRGHESWLEAQVRRLNRPSVASIPQWIGFMLGAARVRFQ